MRFFLLRSDVLVQYDPLIIYMFSTFNISRQIISNKASLRCLVYTIYILFSKCLIVVIQKKKKK
jgi:hypothetical protein